jgi:hypothetical protein
MLIEGSLDILADACQEASACPRCCATAPPSATAAATRPRRGLAECRRFIRDNRRPWCAGGGAARLVHRVRRHGARGGRAVPRPGHRAARARRRGPAPTSPTPRARLRRAADRAADAPGRAAAGSILAHGVHLDAAQVRAPRPSGAAGWCRTRAPTRATRRLSGALAASPGWRWAPTATPPTCRPKPPRCAEAAAAPRRRPAPRRAAHRGVLLAERFGGSGPAAAVPPDTTRRPFDAIRARRRRGGTARCGRA